MSRPSRTQARTRFITGSLPQSSGSFFSSAPGFRDLQHVLDEMGSSIRRLNNFDDSSSKWYDAPAVFKPMGSENRFVILDNQLLYVSGTGYVGNRLGVGSISPSHKLDVDGDIRIRGNDIRDNSGNPAISMDGSANTNIVNTGSAGEFGVGTTSPGTMLQVEGVKPYLTLKNISDENTDGGAESKIIFEDHANNTLAQIQASHDGTDDNANGDLIFSNNMGSGIGLTETLKIGSDGKTRVYKLGPGSAYGIYGVSQYQIAELSDILFRADLRFLNYNSKSGTQSKAAAIAAGEITSWRKQIATNRGNTVQEPADLGLYIDTTGMASAVNRRRSPTFSGTFSSSGDDDYIDLRIDSLASGRRAVNRSLLHFASASNGSSIGFSVPGSAGGPGAFSIEYNNNPSAAADKIIIDFDHADNANSDPVNIAQLTALILNGTNPDGQARTNGGGNYTADWGVYANSGVGQSGFTSGLDAVVASVTSELDIFASTKGDDSTVADNIQITNVAGTIRAGSDDTPLSRGKAANGHAADTFKWKISSDSSYTEGVQITGGSQALGATGVSVTFDRTTGFSLGSGVGGGVEDSWWWYKVRNDLPETLFNSDFDSRIEMQNGETHKFVMDFSGVSPYGVSYEANRRRGVIYPQGELLTTFYFNFDNFSSVTYRGYYSSAYPESDSYPHQGWKTVSGGSNYFESVENISQLSGRTVNSLKLGSKNYLTTFEVTIDAAAETGAESGRIAGEERTAVTSFIYLTDRARPGTNEPVTLLKTLNHQSMWGALEFPSGSASLPSVSFRDGVTGSNADTTRSDTGFFMSDPGKVSTSIEGNKISTFFSGGLEISSSVGVFTMSGSGHLATSTTNLVLSSSGNGINFVDSNVVGSTWSNKKIGIPLSDSSSQWSLLQTQGFTSLLDAILDGGIRQKVSGTIGNAGLNAGALAGLSIDLSDIDANTRSKRVEVYLNGVLMLSGSPAETSSGICDYSIDTSGGDNATDVKFAMALDPHDAIIIKAT